MTLHAKDPQAMLDYGIDWSAWLAADEVISDSAWRAEPDGDLELDGMSHDGSSARVTVAGGVAGRVYCLVNTITTSLGRSDERSITIRIVER